MLNRYGTGFEVRVANGSPVEIVDILFDDLNASWISAYEDLSPVADDCQDGSVLNSSSATAIDDLDNNWILF